MTFRKYIIATLFCCLFASLHALQVSAKELNESIRFENIRDNYGWLTDIC
ncbi:hypothetical protein [Bacteroides coprosuis]|nr:hypothetical protein [Bacteroides coprosuis]HJD93235.1 hypothetical protein [Bacteroides coprosuis]